MSTVYVANGTFQNLQFNYRLPGVDSLRILEVRAGSQAKFQEDFDDGELAAVIQQLERYGGRPASSVSSIVTPRALVYRVDRKPISSDAIDDAREADQKARQNVAAEQTEASGLAQFQQASTNSGGRVVKTSLEVEQMQDELPGQHRKRGGVDTEVVVDRNAGVKETRKRRG